MVRIICAIPRDVAEARLEVAATRAVTVVAGEGVVSDEPVRRHRRALGDVVVPDIDLDAQHGGEHIDEVRGSVLAVGVVARRPEDRVEPCVGRVRRGRRGGRAGSHHVGWRALADCPADDHLLVSRVHHLCPGGQLLCSHSTLARATHRCPVVAYDSFELVDGWHHYLRSRRCHSHAACWALGSRARRPRHAANMSGLRAFLRPRCAAPAG